MFQSSVFVHHASSFFKTSKRKKSRFSDDFDEKASEPGSCFLTPNILRRKKKTKLISTNSINKKSKVKKNGRQKSSIVPYKGCSNIPSDSSFSSNSLAKRILLRRLHQSQHARLRMRRRNRYRRESWGASTSCSTSSSSTTYSNIRRKRRDSLERKSIEIRDEAHGFDTYIQDDDCDRIMSDDSNKTGNIVDTTNKTTTTTVTTLPITSIQHIIQPREQQFEKRKSLPSSISGTPRNLFGNNDDYSEWIKCCPEHTLLDLLSDSEEDEETLVMKPSNHLTQRRRGSSPPSFFRSKSNGMVKMNSKISMNQFDFQHNEQRDDVNASDSHNDDHRYFDESDREDDDEGQVQDVYCFQSEDSNERFFSAEEFDECEGKQSHQTQNQQEGRDPPPCYNHGDTLSSKHFHSIGNKSSHAHPPMNVIEIPSLIYYSSSSLKNITLEQVKRRVSLHNRQSNFETRSTISSLSSSSFSDSDSDKREIQNQFTPKPSKVISQMSHHYKLKPDKETW